MLFWEETVRLLTEDTWGSKKVCESFQWLWDRQLEVIERLCGTQKFNVCQERFDESVIYLQSNKILIRSYDNYLSKRSIL